LTSLNLAKNHLGSRRGKGKYSNPDPDNDDHWEWHADMSGIVAIADVIPGMGAILSVNLLKNDIGVAQAEGLVSILKEHPTLKSLCGNTGNETELNMSGKMYGAADAILLVPEIIDNGALLVLSLQSNNLCAAGGKALAEGLKDNRVITELNIASNRLGYKTLDNRNGADMSGVIALADVIPDMGALTRLNISKNNLFHDDGAPVGKALSDMLAVNSSLQELDVSGNAHNINSKGGPSFARALSVGISDNGAMTSLNLASNCLGVAGAKIIAAVLPMCT
jgi:hypothetical protein